MFNASFWILLLPIATMSVFHQDDRNVANIGQLPANWNPLVMKGWIPQSDGTASTTPGAKINGPTPSIPPKGRNSTSNWNIPQSAQNIPQSSQSGPLRGISFDVAENVHSNDEGPACSQSEKDVLGPFNQLQYRIKGKIGTNATMFPKQKPQACYHAKTLHDLTLCYQQWGFVYQVAACWAKEELLTNETCGEECGIKDNHGTSNGPCQECLAHLRYKKHKCAFTAMFVSDKCQNCQMDAYEYWDKNCMMRCLNPFYGNKVMVTQTCRECNDAVEWAMHKCDA